MMPRYSTAKKVDEPVSEVYNKWILTITLWPKTCIISGKQIDMMAKAYVNKDMFCERWALPSEFTMARLKGDI